MVAQHIGFGVIAAMMAVAAIRVVTTRYVVHAALWLVVVLAGVAAQFILLSAEFVAAKALKEPTAANSAMKKSRNRIPEYSVM